MKIEIGESLGYSYLRHVKQCWLVQANWKVSEHWVRLQTGEILDEMFSVMKESFDPDGSVFKGTKDANQLLKQAEIDVVGVDQSGGIHAMETAFHEAGLNYGGGADKRVLKKLLRTMITLDAYHPSETARHIYFVSPKVNPGVQLPLKDIFSRLREAYQHVDWHLMTNESFTDEMLVPALAKAGSVADTSELFVRSAKLLELSGLVDSVDGDASRRRRAVEPSLKEVQPTRDDGTVSRTPEGDNKGAIGESLQDIVRSLMQTLLERQRGLLSETDLRNLMDTDYCKDDLGLRISNFSLLRRRENGRMISGHGRYWSRVYGGEFYVTSQWRKQFHRENAEALLRFVAVLKEGRTSHPGLPQLEQHERVLRSYVGRQVAV